MQEKQKIKISFAGKVAQRAWLLGLVDCPLRVIEVKSAQDWQRVATLRKVRYEEHLATAVMPTGPDEEDSLPTVRVVLVEHKVTGELLGTIRYRDTTQGASTSHLDGYIPKKLTDQFSYSWADRLVVARTPWAMLAKAMLMKAYYYMSVEAEVDYMSLHTRAALERSYRAMGFKEQDGEVIRMETCGVLGAVPHCFLVLQVARVADEFDARLVPFIHRRHSGLDWPQQPRAAKLLERPDTRSRAQRIVRALRAA